MNRFTSTARLVCQRRPTSVAATRSITPRSFSRSFSTKLYTKDHEWLQIDGHIGTVGISDYAQKALGDVVFVDLPDVGKLLTQGDVAVSVESVKAASDVYSPASGEVTEVNEALRTQPDLVNSASLSNGWMFKLKLSQPDEEIKSLKNEESYAKFCESEDENH
ncbi:glycine decarboxylase complex subunit H (predicted) [Planoprotostelium fungivorum]|uniref:Glycine cleavage system H protein n=1 Tax=Planoprotostelium fungivorum TaxID=1890364 RepID=A0A2P6MYJ4_9EUKA|nr:glycine decarboxylase complex subunit H (predicted) [Planoprotostelium fungivorum]